MKCVLRAYGSEEKVISSFALIYYARGLALCIPLPRPLCCHLVQHIFPCDAFYCAVVLVFARGLAQRRGAKKCFSWCCVQHGFQKLVFKKIESSWVFLLQSISGIGNKKSWFPRKNTSFWEK